MQIAKFSECVTITSREIAGICGKRHDNVMVDCRKLSDFYAEKYSPEKSGQSIKSSTYIDSTGRVLPCMELDKDACVDLITGYSLEHRHAVNQRWKELEATQSQPFKVPQTMAEALRLAADQQDLLAQQQIQLDAAAPKVEFVWRYVQAEGAKGFREVAKLLQANEAEFRAFLSNEKIMYRLGGDWVAYQNHADAGRFVVKTGVAPNNEKAYTTTKFTPKGINWIAGEWGKYKLTLGDKS